MKNTCVMTIAPVNTKSIVTHVLTSQGVYIFGDTFGVQSLLTAEFVNTTCTGTCVPQIKKTDMAFFTVLPEDIYFIS